MTYSVVFCKKDNYTIACLTFECCDPQTYCHKREFQIGYAPILDFLSLFLFLSILCWICPIVFSSFLCVSTPPPPSSSVSLKHPWRSAKKDIAIGRKADLLLLFWSITQLITQGHCYDQRESVCVGGVNIKWETKGDWHGEGGTRQRKGDKTAYKQIRRDKKLKRNSVYCRKVNEKMNRSEKRSQENERETQYLVKEGDHRV